MRQLRHVSTLDGFRGLAILMVLGVHSNEALLGGWLGVHLFFVLSGLLITSLLLNEWATSGISFAGFYRRRALRLFPALFAMLAAYLVFAFAVAALDAGGDLERSLLGAAYGAGYVTNMVSADSVPNELKHLWSLAVEEQFYVIWPLALMMALRLRVGPVLLIAALAGLIAATGAQYDLTSIAIGCMAGIAYSFRLVTRAPVHLATVLLVPALLLVAVWDNDDYAAPVTLLFTIPAGVVLLAATLSQEWWLPRLVDRRILRWFGRISYGLYVWHWPLILALGWELGVPLAILVAVLSYRFVEQPFLRRKRWRAAPRDQRAAVTSTAAA